MYAESIQQQTELNDKPSHDTVHRKAPSDVSTAHRTATKYNPNASVTQATRGRSAAMSGVVVPFNTFARAGDTRHAVQRMAQPLLAPSFDVSGTNMPEVSKDGVNDTVQLMANSQVIQRTGKWDEIFQRVFPDPSLGAQLLSELAKDVVQEELFDLFMRWVIIPVFKLDPLLKAGVDWAKNALVTAAAPYTALIGIVTKILELYNGLSDEARVVLKYLIGVAINYLGKLISWAYKGIFGSEPKQSAFWIFENILAADGSAFVSGVQNTITLAQGLLSDNPATALFSHTKDYLWKTFSGWFGGTAPETQDDEETQKRVKQKALVTKKLKAGPLEVGLDRFGIAKESTENEITKHGGIDAKFSAKMSLFGKTASIGEGDENAQARLDWDGNFVLDYSGGAAGKKIIPAFDLFGLFSTQGVYVDRLIAGNKGLEMFSAHIQQLKFNQYVSASKVSGTWDPTGFTFVAQDLTLALPELTSKTGEGTIHVSTKPDGSFESLKVINAKIGDLTLDGAYLDAKKKSFKLQNMRYPLPEPVEDFTAVLSLLELNKSGLQSIKGGVSVADWEPMEGLKVSGALMLSWQKKKMAAELQKVLVDVDADPISGSANLALLTFTFGDLKSLKGDLASLSFALGPLSFLAEKATFGHDNLHINMASMVLATDDKAAKGKVKDISADNGTALLTALKSLSGAVQVIAKDIDYAYDTGFRVGSYDTKLIAPAISVSLFGGLLKGAVNPRDKSASLTGQFTFPPTQKFWPGFGISIPMSPTPLMLFVDAGLRGGITANVKAILKKPDDIDANYAYGGKLNGGVDASLEAYLQGGVKIGTSWLMALRAYLEASAGFNAKGSVDASFKLGAKKDGTVGEQEKGSRQDKPELNFDFAAGLNAGIAFKVDLKTFITETKELYKYNLKTWELGMADVKGKVTTDDKGKLKLLMEKPKSQEEGGNPKTLGGALRSDISLPDNFLEPISPKEALATMDPKETLSRDETFALINEILDPVWGYHKEEQNALLDAVRFRSKVKSTFSSLTTKATDFKAGRAGKNFSYIMGHKEWMQYSTTRGTFGVSGRKAIKAVDKEVRDYERNKFESNTAKLAVIGKLQQAIKGYVEDQERGRVSMANFLWKQTEKEIEYLKRPTPESLEDIDDYLKAQ